MNKTTKSGLKIISLNRKASFNYFFKEFFELQKVTIRANKNGAGGYTLFTPIESATEMPSKKFLLANLIISLGGRAAEIILNNDVVNTADNYYDNEIFNNFDNLYITTGATGDLQQVYKMARQYITQYGLGEQLLYESGMGSQPFLGRDLAMGSDKTSEYSKDKMDKEVERIINFAYDKTLDIIKQNINSLDKISDLLIKKISIDYKELKNIDIKYT